MSDIFAGVPFPHRPLRAAAALVLLSLAATTLVVVCGWGPRRGAESPARLERDLYFLEHSGGGIGNSAGGIDVIDAHTGGKIDELKPGADGFIRATLRGLARERLRRGLGAQTPFHLALRRDGSLTLDDPVTARHIELQAFGSTNSGAFVRLLTAGTALPAMAPQQPPVIAAAAAAAPTPTP